MSFRIIMNWVRWEFEYCSGESFKNFRAVDGYLIVTEFFWKLRTIWDELDNFRVEKLVSPQFWQEEFKEF